MIHDYRINYHNISLRPLERGDIENLRNWRNEPGNTTYLSKIPYITPEMQAAWFENYIGNREELCFAIIENQDLHRMVGSLSLYGFSNHACLFGKILIGDVDAHGKKVGVNATKAAVSIAFGILNYSTVNLFVYAENKAACKIYREAGFEIVDEHLTEDGRREYTMSISRGETTCTT